MRPDPNVARQQSSLPDCHDDVTRALPTTRLVTMKTVLLIEVDLFFRAKIEATLTAAGYAVTTSSDAAADLVVADVTRCDPDLVVAAHEGVPVLGFGRHADAHLLRQAREAGFSRVIPRSVLAKRLPQVVEALLNPAVTLATSRVNGDGMTQVDGDRSHAAPKIRSVSRSNARTGETSSG
jgi:hypothetical protein